MIYLIVGVDRHSFAPWHQNIAAPDKRAAKRTARTRAQARGVELVVAAVIGPNSTVLRDPAPQPAVEPTVAPVAAPPRAA